MNGFEIKAWVGSNPLHVLASLGALVLTDDAAPGQARLSWRRGTGGWHPVIHTQLGQAAWVESLAARIAAAGRVHVSDEERRAISRGRNDAKAAEKSAAEVLKKRNAELKALAKKEGVPKGQLEAWLEARNADERRALDAASQRFKEEEARLADGLGVGPAHLGDLAGVDASIFRQKADAALRGSQLDRVVIRQLSALASDGCLSEGCVQPTPFSFGNGSGGQFLLKDFRSLSQKVEARMMNACVEGTALLFDETSLNS